MNSSDKRRRITIISVILAIVFILMGVSTISYKNSFFARNFINTITSPFRSVVCSLTDGIGGFFNYVFEMKNMNEENTRLANENAMLRHSYRDAESYKKENDELRHLLELEQSGGYGEKKAAAEIIGWSSDNWYNQYAINKGSSSGIKVGDIVFAQVGLVGRVCEVGLNWASVSTIIDSASSVGAKVIRTGDVAIVEGDFKYEKDGLCKMTFINKDAHIIIGDTLETSGLGGSYPSGIPMGKVVEIVTDNAGMAQYALVEPYADFDSLKFVYVAEGKVITDSKQH